MILSNPPKALIVLAALICLTVLMMAQRIDTESGVGLIGLIVGYGIGNGIAAKQNDAVSPIFSPRNPHRRSGDS